MANIKDVARLAGVSVSTASRVVRGEGYTSPEMRAKVGAPPELHYVPNALARSMRGRPTRMISFLVYDIVNPFFANLATGVEDTAQQQGFTVVICSSQPWKDKSREQSYMRMLLQSRIDGIVMQHVFSSPEYFDLLQRQNIPAARVVNPQQGYPYDLVRCDTTQASCDLIEHLLRLGRRRIAALGPALPSHLGGERLAGYKLALERAGLEIAPDLIMLKGWRTRWLQNDPRPAGSHPSLMPSSPLARALPRACLCAARTRLRVPEDIALVCVDDFGMGSELDPFHDHRAPTGTRDGAPGCRSC